VGEERTGEKMTIDERLERIEHITAGMAEQARKDREDSRQLGRETQRQIGEVAANLNVLTLRVGDVADRVVEVDERLGARIDQLAKESREADARLGERIETLVSAIGRVLPK